MAYHLTQKTSFNTSCFWESKPINRINEFSRRLKSHGNIRIWIPKELSYLSGTGTNLSWFFFYISV